MSLTPLANLVAVQSRSQGQLEDVQHAMEASPAFTQVWRPAPGWVAAVAPLPGPPVPVRGGLVVLEGGDLFAGTGGDASLDHLCETVDRSPDRLARLPGDVALLRFRDGSVSAMRSCGGLVPLYLQAGADSLTVSTRLRFIEAFAPERPVIDEFTYATWAGAGIASPDDRSFFAGGSVVPRGTVLTTGIDRPREAVRYWSPPRPGPRPPTPTERREHSTRLRDALLLHLDRHLDPSGANLLSLSGGVDSSALGALAAGTLGRPLAAISLLAQDEVAYELDRRYVEALTARFAIDPLIVLRLDWQRWFELLLSGPQVVMPVLHPILCALPTAMGSTPCRVLVGGEHADALFGINLTTEDWFRGTSLMGLVGSLRRRGLTPGGRRQAVPRWAMSRTGARIGERMPHPVELPRWARSELREEYRDWRRDTVARAALDPHPRRALRWWADLDGFVAQGWEASSEVGVRRCFPFHSREVIELGHELHPAELFDGQSKVLFREGLADDVPHLNLHRPKESTGPAPPDPPSWPGPMPDGVFQVVSERWRLPSAEPLTWDDVWGLAPLIVALAKDG